MSTPRWRLPTSAPVAEKYHPNPRPTVPPSPTVARKERFAELNKFVTARHGFLTSIPGSSTVTMETLPDSTLPAELAALGYEIEATGEGERILSGAIVQKFERVAGELVLLTAESTRPVAQTLHHAGIVRIERYSFSIE